MGYFKTLLFFILKSFEHDDKTCMGIDASIVDGVYKM